MQYLKCRSAAPTRTVRWYHKIDYDVLNTDALRTLLIIKLHTSFVSPFVEQDTSIGVDWRDDLSVAFILIYDGQKSSIRR